MSDGYPAPQAEGGLNQTIRWTMLCISLFVESLTLKECLERQHCVTFVVIFSHHCKTMA